MKNKRGGDKIISVYWFAILLIVAGAIVYMAALFYGAPYYVRGIESEILTGKIADCLSQGGYLKENVRSDDFKDNFLEECSLNFDVEDVYGWEAQEQYYVEVSFCEFNQDSLDGCGEQIFNLVEGNVNLKTSFLLERAEERKNKNEMVVIHFTAGHSAKDAIETMRDNRLSVHYIVEKDGTVISSKNIDDLGIKKGDDAFKTESRIAQHAGCIDVRMEKIRSACEGEGMPEPGEKCCVDLNRQSIGIELVNLGNMCGSTESYCSDPNSEWTCKSICKDEGKGIIIDDITWEKFTEEQVDSLVYLVADIVSRNNIPINRNYIVGHEEAAPGYKLDPGPVFPWEEFMSRLKAEEKLSPDVGRSFYVVDRNNQQYVIKILSIVSKTEKNVA